MEQRRSHGNRTEPGSEKTFLERHRGDSTPRQAAVAAEFLEHANEEQGHADKIAERIIQLNGEPDFSPDGLLMRSHSEYVEGHTLADMIKEDLVAERSAIESYSEIIRYFGDKDPTSRRLNGRDPGQRRGARRI